MDDAQQQTDAAAGAADLGPTAAPTPAPGHAGSGAAGGADPSVARLEEQVARVENAMIDAEVAVETLRVELDNLAHAHHQRLGPMYRRLDELEALIAEARAARTGAPDDVRRAAEARGLLDDDLEELEAQLNRHQRATAGDGDGAAAGDDPGGEGRPRAHPDPQQEAPRRVRPGREAQRLYRELARHAHPDLVQEPDRKEHRSAFIARVNDAYGRGDEAGLLRLADEWMADPESQPPADAPADRAGWLLNRLERMRARIDQLVREHERLEASPMGELRRLAPDDPDGLLMELADRLLAQVAEKERELAGLGGG